MNLKSGISIFFNDLINFFRGGRILGIDIGTASIKLVELSRKKGEFVLENYGILELKEYLERSNRIIQSSSLKMVEKEVVDLLSLLIKEVRPKSKVVYASMPTFSAFSTVFDMPLIPEKEIEKVISFQARQYVPLPISEVHLEWLKTAEFENERGQKFQKILINAIPREIIKKYYTIFKTLGFSLIALELEGYSLARILSPAGSPPTLVIDLGAVSSSFYVFENGLLEFVGQSDYAGASLTQAISRSLDISPLRAEELKRRRGLLGSQGTYELSTALMPFLDVIIQEGQRIIHEYEQNYNKKVEKIILVGGGANLPGIEIYFHQQMGLIVEEFSIFKNIKYPNELEPMIKNLSRNLPIALSLALNGFM